ncbi:uncharacterized protein RCC_02791 [Ramularia collo-cygni]|uniref:Uncharacterized protein n=1 Tax=Ramularia collo-cygni TaxID=112498 RepID=A0A2D3V652_9PEZI|nr:uncharacterized protein RCC_02791 [Ramularia collo-cygni]CZT16959.1 uncharacterized protein RCC_02791 [Ramularia collo-cygni]
MGLPIWRDPREKVSAPPPDRTAGPRSSIRRRPSIHGRHSAHPRARLAREATGLPPRFERSPPPPAVGFNGMRNPRRGEDRGVPPISSLLEAADRSTFPPAPVPESGRLGHWIAGSDEGHSERYRRRYAARMLLQETEARRSRADLRQIQMRARQAEQERAVDNTDADEPTMSASWREPDGPADASGSPTLRSVPIYAIVASPGEMLRGAQSPGLHEDEYRPQSPDHNAARRLTLPTPPLDVSGPEDGPLIEDVEVSQPHTNRRSHPLSSTWRIGSPSINGLGDRNRSPTPGDGWEIIRTTITPDETLPSADSSFASSAASRSFNAPTTDTQITEPEPEASSSERSRGTSSGERRAESTSSLNLDDLACTDEDLYNTEAFASDMWYHEMRTPEGRARIARHEELHQTEGNRFAHSWEPASVDIGFRLIEEALDTDEGRRRVMQIRQDAPENIDHFNTLLSVSRRIRDSHDARDRPESRSSRDMAGSQPPSPRPDLYNQQVLNAIQAANQQTQEYLRVFRSQTQQLSPTSPPPDYEAPASSIPDVDTATSQDGPQPHPVSPPSLRSEREVSEALLSGDVQDLDSMRRVIERIAQRDDVPESWWMSMGLNLSRTRPRERSAERRRLERVHAETNRVRSGRVERGSSRL